MPIGSNYTQRINRVVNHISADPTRSYRVDELAALAHFSPFHFHRLFKAITGETPNELARRIRLERAAAELLYRSSESMTKLAMDLGFSSSANFSKAFAAHFGCAPSRYAAQLKNTDNAEIRKIGKAPTGKRWDTPAQLDTTHSATKVLPVKIVDEPSITLAYVRHRGAYQPDVIEGLFQQLYQWAGDNLANPLLEPVGITWSDSSVADPTTWQYDAALVVPQDTHPSGGIDIQHLPPTTVAQLRVKLDPPDYSPLAAAWDTLLGHWLPSSQWQPGYQPSYERYNSSADSGPQITTLCLPLEPLN